MKKTILTLACSILLGLLVSSCAPVDVPDIDFDSALLVGKWQSGTLFEKYAANGTGTTWDTADDITEDEASKFNWTLVRSTLTQIHILETTQEATVPRVYRVKILDDTTLKYVDEGSGKSYLFTKVQ